jgi:hypothetical protein
MVVTEEMPISAHHMVPVVVVVVVPFIPINRLILRALLLKVIMDLPEVRLLMHLVQLPVNPVF